MTTTTRICLDMLTSARARREEYVGPWLPEPVVDTAALAPGSRTELAEDLSIALLLILDQLSPLERDAFLLHDVFDFSFREVATALERSEAALNAIDGADRVARFLVDATRKRPGAWWREDFILRFATTNGLPGVIVDAPDGPVQTAAFEIEGDVIRALYVVRNPDKLRHLTPARHESGPE
jgi:hypothetical protein